MVVVVLCLFLATQVTQVPLGRRTMELKSHGCVICWKGINVMQTSDWGGKTYSYSYVPRCPGPKLLCLCHAHAQPHWRVRYLVLHKQIDCNGCSKRAEPPPCEFAIPWAQTPCETLHLLSYCNNLAGRQLVGIEGVHLPTSELVLSLYQCACPACQGMSV